MTLRSIAVVRPAVEKTCWPRISSGSTRPGLSGHVAVVLGLHVRERVALEVELDRLAPQQREGLPVDPRRAAVDRLVADGRARAEVHAVGGPPLDRRLAGELVLVFLGQADVERQRRDLVGLQDRELRDRAALPADAVQVELLPGPVRGLSPLEEIGAADRQVQAARQRGDAEAERRRPSAPCTSGPSRAGRPPSRARARRSRRP